MNKKPTAPIYPDVRSKARKNCPGYIKDCFIAHVKRDLGYDMGSRRSKDPRKHPCPDEFRPYIEAAFKDLDTEIEKHTNGKTRAE